VLAPRHPYIPQSMHNNTKLKSACLGRNCSSGRASRSFPDVGRGAWPTILKLARWRMTLSDFMLRSGAEGLRGDPITFETLETITWATRPAASTIASLCSERACAAFKLRERRQEMSPPDHIGEGDSGSNRRRLDEGESICSGVQQRDTEPAATTIAVRASTHQKIWS